MGCGACSVETKAAFGACGRGSDVCNAGVALPLDLLDVPHSVHHILRDPFVVLLERVQLVQRSLLAQARKRLFESVK